MSTGCFAWVVLLSGLAGVVFDARMDLLPLWLRVCAAVASLACVGAGLWVLVDVRVSSVKGNGGRDGSSRGEA